MQIKRSTLIWIGFIFTLYMVLIETMLYFESFNPNSPLSTFSEGFWYFIVTITSVGYGDYVPTTTGGKVIGSIFVLSSLVSFGFIIGRLTNYISKMNENKKMGFNGTKFENHTVIVGWNGFSRSVADQLIGVGSKVAILTQEKANIDLILEHYHHSKNLYVLFTEFDNFDLIKNAKIDKASTVFLNASSDTDNLVHLLNYRKEYTSPNYIVMLDNADLRDTFRSAGVTYAVSKHEISSQLLASYIFEPDVAEFGEEIISNAKNDTEYDIMMYRIIATNPYVNKDYEDVFFDLKKTYNTVLIGITKNIDGKRKLIKNPSEPITVEIGDYLVFISNGKNCIRINEVFGVEEGVV